jgi:hypothetical protein
MPPAERRFDPLPGPPQFNGEVMVCILCGREQKWDRAIEALWTAIEIRGEKFFGCPFCVPNGDAGRPKFERAVYAALKKMGANI